MSKILITEFLKEPIGNEYLKLVPDDADLCVCTDLDEVFETGWRKRIEDN